MTWCMAGKKTYRAQRAPAPGEDSRDRYGSAQRTHIPADAPRAPYLCRGTQPLPPAAQSQRDAHPHLSADEASLPDASLTTSIDMTSSRLARTLTSIAAGALAAAALTTPVSAQGQPNTGTGP